MTITYFPFGSGAGSTVDEAQWAAMAQWFRETGVVPDANNFEVYGDASGMQVKVKTGSAIIQGVYVNSDAEVILSVTTADGSNPRIDRVILQVDWTANTVSLEMLDGTAAASPVAPTLTQDTSTWEISLAQVYVGAGVSTINSGNVTDEREFSLSGNDGAQLGGRVTKTISSGAISVDAQAGISFIVLAGEGATADTLTDINMTNPRDGALILLRGAGYDITIVNTGNLSLGRYLDQVVIRNSQSLLFIWDAGFNRWQLISPEYAGKRSIFLPAMAWYPVDQVNTLAELTAFYYPTLSFIDADVDYAVVNVEMPVDYDGGSLTCYIWWMAGGAVTTAVVWQLQVKSLADGESLSAYDNTDTVIDNGQSATSEVLKTGAITLNPVWNPGELLNFRIARLGTNGSDTMTQDAKLVGVKIEYDTNKTNQS